MKVRINFDSNDIEECVDFRNQLVDLIEKIDNEVLHYDTDKEDYEDDSESDPNEGEEYLVGAVKEYFNKYSALSRLYITDINKSLFVDKKFIEDLYEANIITNYKDVESFDDILTNLIKRNKEYNNNFDLAKKLEKAGFTKEFAIHCIDKLDKDTLEKISLTEYSPESFDKLLEALRIKRDFQEEAKASKEKSVNLYIDEALNGTNCEHLTKEEKDLIRSYIKTRKIEDKHNINSIVNLYVLYGKLDYEEYFNDTKASDAPTSESESDSKDPSHHVISFEFDKKDKKESKNNKKNK